MLNLLAVPSVIALGGMNVALVDLVVLAILLIALIVGLVKGFVGQIFALLGGIAAIVVAIFTCTYVAGFLSTTFPSIPEAISAQVNSLLGLDGVLLQGAKDQIISSLQQTSVPVFLHEVVADLIIQQGANLNLTEIITGWVVTAIAFIVTFVLALIVFGIFKKIFKALTNIPAINAIDRILGMIFRVALTLAILVVVFIVLSLFANEFVNGLLQPVTETGEQVKCFFNDILSWVMNLDFIKNLLLSIVK